MGKNRRGIGMKRNLIFLTLVAFLLGGASISPSYGERREKGKWGLSFSGGIEQKSRYELKTFALLPRYERALHKNWNLEFEGNIWYYGICHSKDLYLLGLNTNIIFKPIRWNRGSLFLLGGGGLAYNNNNDNGRRVMDIGDSHLAGILQIGSGIQYRLGKGLWLRGEYRFHHVSDPFQKDSGINTHNLILGISF